MQMQPQNQRDAFNALLETFTFQDDPECVIIKALSEWCELKDGSDHLPDLVDIELIPDLLHHADIVVDRMQTYIERDPEEDAAEAKGEYLSDLSRGC